MRYLKEICKCQLRYFVSIVFVCIFYQSFSQCSVLNRPTVLYTFGTGTSQYSNATSSDFGFSTTYAQELGAAGNGTRVNDGEFSFVNRVANPWNVWHENVTDHTGDGGYMMQVNADYDPGEFYRDTITGLCTGINYEFSVWIGNLDHNNQGIRINPNVRFEIRDPFQDTLLAFYETGDVIRQNNFTWVRHAVNFDATTNEVILLLINNNPGGSGNDLVLDDVAFTPCLPVYDITGDTVLCKGQDLNLNADLITSAYATPEYLWQKKDASGNWVDIIEQINLSVSSVVATDSGWYRVLIAEMGSIISELQCRSIDSVYVSVADDLDPGSIGTNQTICYDTAPQEFVSVSDASSSSEAISYQWEVSIDLNSWSNASSSNSTFQENNLTSLHHYRRKAQTDCFMQYSDTIYVVVRDELTNNVIIGDQIVCDGHVPDLITVSNAITGGQGNYTLQWQSSTDATNWLDLPSENATSYQSVLIDEDVSIRLLASDFCGDRYSNIISLDYQLTPLLDSIFDSICQNDIVPVINVSGMDVQWYTDNQITTSPPVFNSSDLGLQKYFVTQTIKGCESAFSSIALFVNSVPSLTIADVELCHNDTFSLIPLITEGIAPFVFSWKNITQDVLSSDSIYTAIGLVSEDYSLDIVDQNGCSDNSSVSVLVNSNPLITIADTNLCENDQISIIPDVSNGNGVFQYEWFDQNDNSVASSDQLVFEEVTSQNYTLIVADAKLCKDTAVVFIEVFSLPIVNLSDTSLCDGQSIIILPSLGNINGTLDYSWRNSSLVEVSTTSSYLFSSSSNASLSLVVSNENHCKDTAYVDVIVHSKPELMLTNTNVCEGESVTLTPQLTNANGTIAYSWIDSNDVQIENVANFTFGGLHTSKFVLQVEDQNFCKDTADVEVVVFEKPRFDDMQEIGVCSGDPDTLRAVVNNYTLGLNYKWSPSTGLSNDNSATVVAIPSITTDYLLTVTTDQGCINTLSHTVGVTETPTASLLGHDTILCEGEEVTYSGLDDPLQEYSFEWYISEDGVLFDYLETKSELTIFEEGYYKILVRNKGFCPVWSDVVRVKKELITVDLISDKSLIYTGENVELIASSSSDVQELIWSTGLQSKTVLNVSPIEDAFYEVVVKGEKCSDNDQVLISVLPPIIIPNGFSPNGDGKNDAWFIKGIEFFPEAEVFIYNRWGNIVFKYTNGYDAPWEGVNLSGEELAVATYYYVIDVNDQKHQKFQGSVSIIR